MIRKSLVLVAVVGAAVATAYLVGRGQIHGREDAELPKTPSAGAFVTVDGNRVHYVEQGDGPALVLLHGLGKSSADWEESVLPLLARRWRVVAIDFLGMGLSERSESFAYGWELWSGQVASTLDALGIDRADVVGHSLGGTVAVVLAARHPERVKRLVLVGSAQSVPWYFIAWLTPGLGELLLGSVPVWGEQPRFSESHHERAFQAYRIRGTRRALLRYSRGSPFEAARLAAAFSSLDLPILQLHGTHDDEVPHGAAVGLHEKLSTSQLVSFARGSHYLMFDSPECFVAELSRFLEGPEAPAWPPRERRLTTDCG